MPKGKKTGGKSFPVGKSGNPKGRPLVPDDLKDARHIINTDFQRAALAFTRMTVQQLQEAIKDPKKTVLELTVAGALGKAVGGSVPHLALIWDRLLPPLPKEPKREFTMRTRVINFPDGSQTVIDVSVEDKHGDGE